MCTLLRAGSEVRVATPDVIAHLEPRHDLAASAHEELEDLERLRCQLDQVAVLAQLAGCRVELKCCKPKTAGPLIENSFRTHPASMEALRGDEHYSARIRRPARWPPSRHWHYGIQSADPKREGDFHDTATWRHRS